MCGLMLFRDASRAVSAALLRLQYSLALVRFVNGVADSAQKSKIALSVASLANQAGIPKLLVDLRHESTHNELPSLSVLRIAAKQALQWLEGKYWEAQRGHLQACMNRLDGVVTKYISSHLKAAAKEAASNRNNSKLGGESSQEKVDGADGNDGNDGNEYDVKQWKKHRQSLLTELKTLVPRGGMSLLVRSLLRCDFASHSIHQEEGISNKVARLACSRVLKQIELEWTGISLLALHEIIKDLFEHVLRGRQLEPESDIWFAVCIEAVESKRIKDLISDFIQRYSSPLKKNIIKWYVQSIDHSSLEALSRLSSILRQLASHARDAHSRKACDQFIDVYLNVSKHDISKDLKVWNSAKSKRKLEEMKPDDVQGKPDGKRRTTWQVAKTWQPCAIGLCPSLINPNGILPDIHAIKKEDGKNEEMMQPESVINETTKHNVFELAPSRRYNHTPTDGATDPDLDIEMNENESDTSSDDSLSSLPSPQSRRSDDGETGSEPVHEPQGACLPPSRLLE